MPTRPIASTHRRALPSRIGTSGPSKSMIALSIRIPCRADMRCSIVATGTSAAFSVVPWSVPPTLSAWAGISTAGLRSQRLKRMPVLAAAGRTVAWLKPPKCNPGPASVNASFIVVCNSIFLFKIVYFVFACSLVSFSNVLSIGHFVQFEIDHLVNVGALVFIATGCRRLFQIEGEEHALRRTELLRIAPELRPLLGKSSNEI